MSTQSPRETASAEAARSQAALSQRLAEVSLPELSSVLGLVRRELGGPDQIPSSISQGFDQARAGLSADYANAGRSNQALLQQQAKQSGERISAPMLNEAFANSALSLDREYAQAQRRLQFQEAQAGLQQYNTLLNLLGQGSGQALRLGQGFAGNQMAALGGLPGTSQFGSALGGAFAGAGLGASVGGPYGALAGGVIGGVAGAFGGGG